MSSHDRKLLKEFYRYFPDVVIFCGFGRSPIPNRYRFADPLSNRQSQTDIDLQIPSQIANQKNPKSKI